MTEKRKKAVQDLLYEIISGIYIAAYFLVAFTLGADDEDYTSWIFYVSLAVCALYCKVLFDFSFKTTLEDDLTRNSTGNAVNENLIGLPCMLYLSFTVALYSGWKLYGVDFMISPTDSTLAWAAYGLDNIVRAALLDFAEVYRLDISPIEHAPSFWPSTFVFVFRSTISIGLISVMIRTVKFFLKERAS